MRSIIPLLISTRPPGPDTISGLISWHTGDLASMVLNSNTVTQWNPVNPFNAFGQLYIVKNAQNFVTLNNRPGIQNPSKNSIMDYAGTWNDNTSYTMNLILINREAQIWNKVWGRRGQDNGDYTWSNGFFFGLAFDVDGNLAFGINQNANFSAGQQLLTTQSVPLNTPLLISISYDSTLKKISMNINDSITTDTNITHQEGSWNVGGRPMSLLAWDNGGTYGYFANVEIYEPTFYNKILNASELLQVRNWYKFMYNI